MKFRPRTHPSVPTLIKMVYNAANAVWYFVIYLFIFYYYKMLRTFCHTGNNMRLCVHDIIFLKQKKQVKNWQMSTATHSLEIYHILTDFTAFYISRSSYRRKEKFAIHFLEIFKASDPLWYHVTLSS